MIKPVVDRSFERAIGGDSRGISAVRKSTFAKRKLVVGKPWDSVFKKVNIVPFKIRKGERRHGFVVKTVMMHREISKYPC